MSSTSNERTNARGHGYPGRLVGRVTQFSDYNLAITISSGQNHFKHPSSMCYPAYLTALFFLYAQVQAEAVDPQNVVSFPLSSGTSSQHQRQEKRRRLQDNPSETFPAFQGYGAYHVDIYVGSPPQKQTVLVDTGSENIGIPCTGCVDCGNTHTDYHFKQTISQSFHKLTCSECHNGECMFDDNTCSIRSMYVDGSGWSGKEVRDYVHPGRENDDNDNKFPLKFTCMESVEGAFKDQLADGIMGLGLRKGSFWRQMYDQGAIASRQFSLCLNNHPLGGHMVGAMTLGGVDDRLVHTSSDMRYMDFDNISGLYEVTIRKIYVHPGGGERLADLDLSNGQTIAIGADESVINAGGVIIDSGTTATLLPPALKDAFDEAWEQATGRKFPTEPIKMSPEELKGWPTIIFQMKGSSRHIHPGPLLSSSHDAGYNQPSAMLDANHPYDVLVAFPPSRYMRPNPALREYRPMIQLDDSYEGAR